MSTSQKTQLITTLSTIKTAPKWSFSGRKDEELGKAQVPGPGAYSSVSPDMGKYSRGPRVTFGTSQRETVKLTTVPGPGQYATQDKNLSNSPRFGFGTAKRQGLARETAVPGPGAYQVASGPAGRGYSVTGRRQEKEYSANSPGPGMYQVNDTSRAGVEKPPSWSFGTSPRAGMVSANSTPGPGAYETPSKASPGPAYSIKARRDVGNKNNITPGPGAHGGMYTQFGY